MLFSTDMKKLIRLFEEHGVQYALVGGHAVNFYGYVRTTQDMDLLVVPTAENAGRIMAALTDFGFGINEERGTLPPANPAPAEDRERRAHQ